MIKSIVTGKRRVLDSGSILFDGKSTVLFTLEIGNGFIVKIEVLFKNKKDAESSINKEVIFSDNYIKITCVNCDNSFCTGITLPLDIATINNKQVSMNIWTYVMGTPEECIRKIDYTYYIEEMH